MWNTFGRACCTVELTEAAMPRDRLGAIAIDCQRSRSFADGVSTVIVAILGQRQHAVVPRPQMPKMTGAARGQPLR
jgi:hypothetical protein